MIRKPLFGFAVILLSALISCNKPAEIIASSSAEKRMLNVSYGKYIRNKMDVYLPANTTSQTPFAVFIHGGYWVAGDKLILIFLQEKLLSKGIASASINYRYISDSLHYDALMEDVGNAVHYCISKSNEWNTRKTNFILGGHSAGAHMALLYAYSFDQTNLIGGIVAISGISNLNTLEVLETARQSNLLKNIEMLANAKYITGQTLHENFKNISPYENIKNTPTLSIHGNNDKVVPVIQAQMLHQKLETNKFINKLVLIEDGSHSLLNVPTQSEFVENEIISWIKIYGK